MKHEAVLRIEYESSEESENIHQLQKEYRRKDTKLHIGCLEYSFLLIIPKYSLTQYHQLIKSVCLKIICIDRNIWNHTTVCKQMIIVIKLG